MLQSIFPATDPKKDVFFGVLPFYHIYGAVKLLLFPFSLGLPVVLTPRFAPTAFCAAVERYKVTIALIVPPLLVVFARDPAIKQHDLRSLTMLFSGAAPLGAKLVKTVRERFLTVGADVCITQGYGLTETSPTTHLLHPKYSESHVGSVGHLCPNLEARLVDEEGEVLRDVNPGESGELWVRGPTIMKGYLNNPSATKASVTPEGWFKTGDIAVRDKDGFYTIVDRRKELIKYKGFQVPPAELESLLLQHPDVADAAVIGVESKEEATELPRAYVVHANPSVVSTPSACMAFEASVQAWVAERVARHKKLRGGVVVIPLVPKSAAGKILRRELRERAKKEEATGQVKAKL
ncbi:hypothetical protein SERLA73DRAFT_186003 [Serpula lacrymans var. lacrymans S7.3]|uniref:AMP-dependent synthetase/ligase domain-containing protein n=2 Tax=Serpula lacrymans var. lacrymans TaxID=341189 RepID=F8Q6S8_SERL3|nr:uncharacterized protein SERLADRAFT_474827 [Serpula lacrymans var. lacrymans S7.9]EGN96316.1 hypothetical protein SERLA73DRAFT_186003 [Serpula lacrymans var. lacrymans S7.3]EGO21853.1 hypothetical protein SERLADRAFT_474827 [Serpula lacrymans var. lacrymans S7.9]